jgi:hypothetical protein
MDRSNRRGANNRRIRGPEMEASLYVDLHFFCAWKLTVRSPSLARCRLLPLRRRCRLRIRCDKARSDRRRRVQESMHEAGTQG